MSSDSNTAVQSTSPSVSDEYALSAVAPPAASQSASAPDKDHISTLLLELGQATAIVDLLFMVASDSDVESLHEDTLDSSLHNVLMRLRAVKVAADAILDEQSAAPKSALEEVAPIHKPIASENISELLSRLDQAMQITRGVGATIPEDAEEGFDRRAAVMGVATLIEGIYHNVEELAETEGT